MDHRCHLRMLMGYPPTWQHPLLHLLRSRHLGWQVPHRHPIRICRDNPTKRTLKASFHSPHFSLLNRRAPRRSVDVGHIGKATWGTSIWGCTRECFVDVCKMIELSTKKPRNFQRNCEDSYNSRCLFLLHLSFSSMGLSVKNLSSFHGEVFLYNSKLFLGT